MQVVELIISDYGDSGHPLHLHGHTFWVMGYGKGEEGPFNETHHRPILRSGVRKETMAVQPRSWLVIRFRANNPGLWLFHCHMNFHFGEFSIKLMYFKIKFSLKKLILCSYWSRKRHGARPRGRWGHRQRLVSTTQRYGQFVQVVRDRFG